MTSSLKPAISNWLWLAELSSQRKALVMGEYPSHLAAGLEKHFETIERHPSAAVDQPIPFESASVDCVVFDDTVGEALVTDAAGTMTLLGETRRVLRPGGCAFVPVSRLAKRPPRRLQKRLRRAGFASIRPIYVFQSFDRPDTLIPASKRATAFFESWAWGGVRGKIKGALAVFAAHQFQRSLFFIAYR